MGLTDEQFRQYQRQGYAVIDEWLDADAVDQLKDRFNEYSEGEREVPEGVNHEVYDNGMETIQSIVPHDDLVTEYARRDEIVEVATQLLGPHVKIFRNSMLNKPAETGGEKVPHQDAPYWSVRPMDAFTVWTALDEATMENGCMNVDPEKHMDPLPHSGEGVNLGIEEEHYDLDDYVPTPLKPGQGLVFHSLTPHYTYPNTSSRGRRTLILSYMSARSRWTDDQEENSAFQIAGEEFPGCV